MRTIKLIITYLCILLNLNSCAQNKEQQMEEIVQEVYKNVHTYKERPVYSVQVDKTGCRFAIEMKGNRDYRFTESNGESMLLPLNRFITKSGKQTAVIKVYPTEGEQYISKYAMINLTFYKAPDKDSNLYAYQEIAKYNLPQGLEEKKLPYYEAQVEFNADVPFDYSKELENAQDLTEISDIEKKILSKYNDVRAIISDLNHYKYEKEMLLFNKKLVEANYITSEEEIRNMLNDIPGIVDPIVEKDRSVLPIENYKMQFYAGNKIVALWHKDKMDGVLRVKGKIKKKDGTYRDVEIPDPLYLYMPQESDELKAW